MYKLLSSLLFLFLALTSWAQISVASFKLDPQDLSAINPSTAVLDQNGYKCALIRVQTTQSGFTFDTGSLLPPEKIDYSHTAEIWLYVPYGVRQINIAHPQLGRMKEWYEFPMPVEKARTYILELVTGEVQTTVKKAVTQQYVVFKLDPPVEGTIDIDGRILEVKEGLGTANTRLAFGTYPYKVTTPKYHPVEGSVTVNDPNNKHEVAVSLQPAFGWLEVEGDATANGATVYMGANNQRLGQVPLAKTELTSGSYHLKFVRDMYKPWETDVNITDGNTTTLLAKLDPNFANVQLTVPNNAEIWVNGEFKGRGQWTGNLGAMAYQFETKAEHHRTYSEERTIQPSTEKVEIDLPAPTPIEGSLDVQVTPEYADIYLDGQKVGQTPMMINTLLEGPHKLIVKKDGYAALSKTIEIKEDETTEVVEDLQEGFSMSGSNSFTVNGVSFTMIPVEGGTFNMGATSEQQNYESDEKPVHSVTLSNYMIGETEVTQELWQAVMGTTVRQQRDKANTSWSIRGEGTNYPMYYISWEECQTFVQKLNAATGQHFRLPTEAEWEYAARGGKQSKGYQYSGSNNLDEVAWYWKNSGDRYLSGTDSDWNWDKIKSNHGKAHPVKTKQPNELGIYDMSGNVWEWCQDWYGDYSSYAQTNPKGPSSGSSRVFRGGSWSYYARICRSAYRDNYGLDCCSSDLGVRLALSE